MSSAGSSPLNPYITGHGVEGTIATRRPLSSQLLKEEGILVSAFLIDSRSNFLSVPHLSRGRYASSS